MRQALHLATKIEWVGAVGAPSEWERRTGAFVVPSRNSRVVEAFAYEGDPLASRRPRTSCLPRRRERRAPVDCRGFEKGHGHQSSWVNNLLHAKVVIFAKSSPLDASRRTRTRSGLSLADSQTRVKTETRALRSFSW